MLRIKTLILTFTSYICNLCPELVSNDELAVNRYHTGSDVTALYECIVEELHLREDRSVIYQLLCEVKDSSVPVHR